MRFIIFITSAAVCLQGKSDTTTVKYFHTKQLRSHILRNEADAKDVKGKPHFKAVYDSNGKLLNIEYIPAPWDKPGRKKAKKTKSLKLYYTSWNPRRTELGKGLTRSEARGRKHFEAVVNPDGSVSSVTEILPSGRRKWTYRLKPESKDYTIEFHSSGTIIALDKVLFNDAASEVRRGWKAIYKTRKDGRPKQVHVEDRLGQRIYFYRFNYSASRDTAFRGMMIRSEYFKDDKSAVGSHETIFDKKRRIIKQDYFDKNKSLMKTVIHEYRDDLKEKAIITINEKGEAIERRIVPY